MNSLDERVYGYEPASSQLRALREENARLQAKLAKVVEALQDIAVVQGKTLTGDTARAALAAAKGGE